MAQGQRNAVKAEYHGDPRQTAGEIRTFLQAALKEAVQGRAGSISSGYVSDFSHCSGLMEA